MRKAFIPFAVIASFTLLLLFTKCQKEYSYEGGPPAVYTLAGSPTQCIPATVNGNYTAGIAADSSNAVIVNVNVTVEGNYSIFTKPVNGLSFTSSGNFSDTGIQVVTLYCSGTPDSTGSFVVQIPGNNGCYFALDVQKQAAAGYTLSGYPNDCSGLNIKGTYIVGTRLTDATAVLNVEVTSPGNYTIKTDTVDGMSFSTSGHFSTTGNQIVYLPGVGIPDSPGLIFFIVTADSSQCGFNIPVTNASPLATYVLQSGAGPSGNPCAPHSIQGNYLAGTLLDGTNSATISVYVTVVGNFSISTGKTDGIVFHLNGTFTTLGAQDVILAGSGTPLVSGDYFFTPQIIGPAPIGGNACEFDINVQ